LDIVRKPCFNFTSCRRRNREVGDGAAALPDAAHDGPNESTEPKKTNVLNTGNLRKVVAVPGYQLFLWAQNN
jgi:hypothetical protein